MRTAKSLALGVALAATLSLSACANLTPTQQRAATGTLGGAAAGAAIGAIAGNAGMGAGIGAGVGLLGGLVYDQHVKSNERAYEQGVQDGRRQRSGY